MSDRENDLNWIIEKLQDEAAILRRERDQLQEEVAQLKAHIAKHADMAEMRDSWPKEKL